MSPLGRFSLADGERYAGQISDLITEACEVVLVAGQVRRLQRRVSGISLVVIPLVMATRDLFDDAQVRRRDLLREALDRLVATGRLERESGMGHRWGSAAREGLYVAPDGERVPLAIRWASEAALGLQYALATGPAAYAQALVTREGRLTADGTRCGLLPRTFSYRAEQLVWTLTGEAALVPDEAALERCLGRRLPEPQRRR